MEELFAVPGQTKALLDQMDADIIAFVPGNVTTGTDRITLTGHGLSTNLRGKIVSDDTIPAGLEGLAGFYIRVVDNNTIELYDAPFGFGGTIIDITSQGVGNHTLIVMNIINIWLLLF